MLVFQSKIVLFVVILSTVILGGSTQIQAQTPPQPKEKATTNRPQLKIPGYKVMTIEGFTTIISDVVLAQNESPEFKRKPLEVLELELKTLVSLMPAKTINALRRVLIWVDWDDKLAMANGRDGFALAIYSGGHQESMLREGKHPLRAKSVSILRMRSLTIEHQPDRESGRCVILHEMTHAVHFEILGRDNPQIKAGYKQALERKLYDLKTYISTNEAEYFAEATCAYFNQMEYFPKTRVDLKQHDPVTFKLMEQIWGKGKDPNQVVDSTKDKSVLPNYTLNQLPPGLLLDGQPFDPRTLASRPVLAYLWNAGSWDSLTAIPKINALHTELADFGLVTVGIHMTGSNVVDFRTEARNRQMVFPLVDARWNSPQYIKDFKDFPMAVVFDHTGQSIYAGTAFKAESEVRRAVGQAILQALGETEAPKSLASVTDALSKGKSPSTVLAQLAYYARSKYEETATAAKTLLARITEPGQRLLDEAEKLAKTNAVDAFLLAERLPTVYRDTLVSSKANNLLTNLKQDKAVVAELKARPLLNTIHKIDLDLQSRPGSFDPFNSKFRNENAVQIKQLTDTLNTLQKSHSKTRAYEQAREIARRYGLSM